MTLTQLNNLLNRTQHGVPGGWWELAVFGDWLAIRLSTFGPDNTDPKAPPQAWPGRYWMIDPADSEDQVKNTMLKAVLTYIEHEARERFLIDGKPLYESRH